jgi:hypothetical protein
MGWAGGTKSGADVKEAAAGARFGRGTTFGNNLVEYRVQSDPEQLEFLPNYQFIL